MHSDISVFGSNFIISLQTRHIVIYGCEKVAPFGRFIFAPVVIGSLSTTKVATDGVTFDSARH